MRKWEVFKLFIKGSWWIWIMAALGAGAVWYFSRGDTSYEPTSTELIEFIDATTGGVNCDYRIPLVSSLRRTENGVCPDESVLTKLIKEFLEDTNTPAEDIREARIWFTSQPINCVNCDKCRDLALGCTNGRQVAVLLQGTSRDWGVTLHVELCHVVVMSTKGHVDMLHNADCYPPGSVRPGQ